IKCLTKPVFCAVLLECNAVGENVLNLVDDKSTEKQGFELVVRAEQVRVCLPVCGVKKCLELITSQSVLCVVRLRSSGNLIIIAGSMVLNGSPHKFHAVFLVLTHRQQVLICPQCLTSVHKEVYNYFWPVVRAASRSAP